MSEQVTFPRRERTGILFGLSWPQVITVGLIIVVIALTASQGGLVPGLVVASVLSAPLTVALVSFKDTPLIVYGWRAGKFALRKFNGQSRWKIDPHESRPLWGVELPGGLGSVEVWQSGLATPLPGVAVAYDPHGVVNRHRGTFSVTALVDSKAFELLSESEQRDLVNGFSRALGAWTRDETIARVTLMERTIPAPPAAIEQHWEQVAAERNVDRSSWAAQVYQQALEQVHTTSMRHESYVTLTFGVSAAKQLIRDAGGGRAGMIHVAAMAAVSAGPLLERAGLPIMNWLNEREWAALARTAFVPNEAALLNDRDGIAPETAIPTAIDEYADHLVADGVWHQVLWVSEWPISETRAGFLDGIVFAPGVQKSFTITAAPVRLEAALKQIHAAEQAILADVAQRARTDRRPNAMAERELADLQERRRALEKGHGDYKFRGLVTISAPSLDALNSARATILSASAHANLELRVLWHQQAAAFCSARLPVGRGA